MQFVEELLARSRLATHRLINIFQLFDFQLVHTLPVSGKDHREIPLCSVFDHGSEAPTQGQRLLLNSPRGGFRLTYASRHRSTSRADPSGRRTAEVVGGNDRRATPEDGCSRSHSRCAGEPRGRHGGPCRGEAD